MSLKSEKLVNKALKNIGAPRGSKNVFATIGKGLGDFFSKPENIEMVVSVGAGVAEGISASKAEGASSISNAEKIDAAPNRPKNVDPNSSKRLKYLGEYKILVGNIRSDLAQKGILTLATQWEMTRNALGEELYSKSFMDNDQKAALVYIIKYIDVHLDKNIVPDDSLNKFIHKGHWSGNSTIPMS
jgi:hypothetical protein